MPGGANAFAALDAPSNTAVLRVNVQELMLFRPWDCALHLRRRSLSLHSSSLHFTPFFEINESEYTRRTLVLNIYIY